MAKKHQQRQAKAVRGLNQPEKTTSQSAVAVAQRSSGASLRDWQTGLTHKADSRRLEHEPAQRSGSDSNAHGPRKSSQLHHQKQAQTKDLASEAELDEGFEKIEEMLDDHLTADHIKELYTTLADLTDDEMKAIVIVPPGTILEQGSRYIDLRHLERGEFVAMADMIALPENMYVAKKGVDYVLWNRLNQIENPARLDEEK